MEGRGEARRGSASWTRSSGLPPLPSDAFVDWSLHLGTRRLSGGRIRAGLRERWTLPEALGGKKRSLIFARPRGDGGLLLGLTPGRLVSLRPTTGIGGPGLEIDWVWDGAGELRSKGGSGASRPSRRSPGGGGTRSSSSRRHPPLWFASGLVLGGPHGPSGMVGGPGWSSRRRPRLAFRWSGLRRSDPQGSWTGGSGRDLRSSRDRFPSSALPAVDRGSVPRGRCDDARFRAGRSRGASRSGRGKPAPETASAMRCPRGESSRSSAGRARPGSPWGIARGRGSAPWWTTRPDRNSSGWREKRGGCGGDERGRRRGSALTSSPDGACALWVRGNRVEVHRIVDGRVGVTGIRLPLGEETWVHDPAWLSKGRCLLPLLSRRADRPSFVLSVQVADLLLGDDGGRPRLVSMSPPVEVPELFDRPVLTNLLLRGDRFFFGSVGCFLEGRVASPLAWAVRRARFGGPAAGAAGGGGRLDGGG